MFTTLALSFPNLDPIAFQFGIIVVRWYALAYVVGILGGWWLIGRLDARCYPAPLLSKKLKDDMIVWGVLSVILGGRIGYVLFYNLPYYLQHPAEALQMWHGGMSFHGGALGVIFGFYLFARVHRIPYLRLMDMICCAVPIGLFFGRIANFVNGELYGRATDVAWGVIFPTGGYIPRHPSQLYEAVLEGLVLFLLLNWMMTCTRLREYHSFIAGTFLLGYGLARFIIEFYREPDSQLGFVLLEWMSMGQVLCIPMMLVGGAVMWLALKRGRIV
jgi:phosphatidylglycerol---prolipoprotein diacylglyceryl transferase